MKRPNMLFSAGFEEKAPSSHTTTSSLRRRIVTQPDSYIALVKAHGSVKDVSQAFRQLESVDVSLADRECPAHRDITAKR